VLAAQHLLGLGCLDLRLVRGQIPVEVGNDVLAGIGEFEQHGEIVAAPRQRLAKRLILLEAPPPLHHLLGLGLVVPESGLFYPAVNLGELLFELCALKDASGALGPGEPDPHVS
jgi:hypothetical protein